MLFPQQWRLHCVAAEPAAEILHVDERGTAAVENGVE
jgi:hypothetical protein